MALFRGINKNNIIKKFEVEKSYTEGVYNDSPLNRKFGRVGMSYSAYAQLVAEGKKEKVPSYNKKYIINDIPENIADLRFKEGKNGHQIATYNVGTKEVTIEMIIKGRDDREYSFIVKEGENIINKNIGLSTKEVTKKMKDLKRIDDGIPLYDKIPLTPEELDEKWGDIGFTYTFYKDNLDLKIWIREDSNKKDPRLNLYVIDRESGKKKNKTNLSLQQVHEELLKYELNPQIDAQLTKEQQREFNKILNEKNFGSDYKKSENYISPLIKELDILNKKGEIKNTNVKIGNYNVSIIPTGNLISLEIKDGVQSKLISIKNTQHDLSLELDKIEEEGDNYKLLDKNAIQPSKNVGVNFNKVGIAYFQDNNSITQYIVDKDNRDNIDIILYDKNGNLLGVDSTNVDDFERKVKNLNLNIDKKNQKEFPSNFFPKNNKIAAKELVENYSNSETLASLPNVIYSYDNYNVEDFSKELNSRKLINNKFNRGKREAYAFIKSNALDKWVRDLPISNKNIKKERIIEDIKNEANRISPSGSKFENGVIDVKRHILKEYY